MSSAFHCPNCGAPLDPPKGIEKSIRCPFCNSTVVIPKELQNNSSNWVSSYNDEKNKQTLELKEHLSQVIALVKSGNKEEAISLFREQFDTSRLQAELIIKQIEKNQIINISDLKYPISSSLQGKSEIQSSNLDFNVATQSRNKSFSQVIIGVIGISIFLFITGFLILSILPGGFLHEFWLKNAPGDDLKLISSFEQGVNGTKLVANPDLITVDRYGNIFISEFETGIIQQFNSDENFIYQWDLGDGKIYIRAMDVDLNGILYIAVDRSIFRINTDDASLLEPIPNPNNFFYQDFKVLSDGTFGAVVDGENLTRIDDSGNIIWYVEDAISSIADESDTRGKLAIDGNNNFYLAGTFVEAVFEYSYDGKYINKIGSEGNDDGQFTGINSITIDQNGQILINDWGWLEIFLPDGRWEKKIDLPNQTLDLDYSLNNQLYVVTKEPKVYIFSINE